MKAILINLKVLLPLASGFIFWAGDVSAATRLTSSECDLAAQHAATQIGVPAELLRSISLVETGQSISGKLQSWPWTINYNGKGYWFDDSSQAIAFGANLMSQGVENFDVGCFQINLRWHPSAFDSLKEAFDPKINSIYAARYLLELATNSGDWPKAVSSYHSRTEEKGHNYLEKVEWALNIVRQNAQPKIIEGNSKNRFPLLLSGEPSHGPSLFREYFETSPLFELDP